MGAVQTFPNSASIQQFELISMKAHPGSNRGRAAKGGGFAETNCLMIDQLICARALTHR